MKQLLRSARATASLTATLFFLFFAKIGLAQSFVQTATGTYNFTVPSGVTSITVQLWGAGGAGGGTTAGTGKAGGGGAGGSYAAATLSGLTSGTTYTVFVGAGGTGASGAAGNPGGTSYFNTSTYLFASGGNGGAVGTSGPIVNGVGGTPVASGGTVAGITPFLGGYGGTGAAAISGGGGGGAGSGSAGSYISATITGTGGSGGTGTYPGGAGANGVTSTGAGTANGNFYGGGGSGALAATTAKKGGAGADGAVVITWSCPSISYATVPYTTSFESTWGTQCNLYDAQGLPDANWDNTIITTSGANSNDYWHRNDYVTASGVLPLDWSFGTGTYTPVSSQGSFSARFDNTDAPTASQGALDLHLNLSSSNSYTLSFDYLNRATSTSATLAVYVSSNGGTSFSPTALISLSNGVSTWTTKTVTIPGTSVSSTTVIRFLATDAGTGDLGIDNLSVAVAVPTLTISNTGLTQIGAQNLAVPSAKNAIADAVVTPSLAGSTVTGISFVTSATSTYTSSDIAAASGVNGGFRLWIGTTSTFTSAVQAGNAVGSLSGAGETIAFSGLSYAMNVGTTYYIWITADVATGATPGHTIIVNGLTTSSITTSTSSTIAGSSSAGGTQTIGGTLTISNTGLAQIGAQTLGIPSTKNAIADATIAAAGTSGAIASISFVTSGTSTYAAADIATGGFKLWYSTTASFPGTATQLGTGVSSATRARRSRSAARHW